MLLSHWHLHCPLLVVACLEGVLLVGRLQHPLALVVERLQLLFVGRLKQDSALPHARVRLEKKWRGLEKGGVGREENRALEQRIGVSWVLRLRS